MRKGVSSFFYEEKNVPNALLTFDRFLAPGKGKKGKSPSKITISIRSDSAVILAGEPRNVTRSEIQKLKWQKQDGSGGKLKGANSENDYCPDKKIAVSSDPVIQTGLRRSLSLKLVRIRNSAAESRT